MESIIEVLGKYYLFNKKQQEKKNNLDIEKISNLYLNIINNNIKINTFLYIIKMIKNSINFKLNQ